MVPAPEAPSGSRHNDTGMPGTGHPEGRRRAHLHRCDVTGKRTLNQVGASRGAFNIIWRPSLTVRASINPAPRSWPLIAGIAPAKCTAEGVWAPLANHVGSAATVSSGHKGCARTVSNKVDIGRVRPVDTGRPTKRAVRLGAISVKCIADG